jgi:hypothetical protein
MSINEQRPLRVCSTADFRAITEYPAAVARQSFLEFRRIIRPDMKWNWWVELISWELQRFCEAFAAGKRPKLALMTPPQHGKSWAVEDFIAWVAGKAPERKTIYASYSDDLGTHRNNNAASDAE